ncbi:hypothetical protein EVA_15547 [gut metagenome]|uniref:Uncharacterized protein n=1 Tax=gut metagenome TaxID=749906 RepID=J9FPF2_9ZZZZ
MLDTRGTTVIGSPHLRSRGWFAPFKVWRVDIWLFRFRN